MSMIMRLRGRDPIQAMDLPVAALLVLGVIAVAMLVVTGL